MKFEWFIAHWLELAPSDCNRLQHTMSSRILGWASGNPALAITPSHQQNMQDFTDGLKNMNYIFDNYVCSESHMCPGRHFQNV